mgnify:CR=1 FL=1
MDKRLEHIFRSIPDGVGVLDVGTDHGYLPVALCRRGYTGNIIATDVNADPLNKAILHAEQSGFSDRIRFLLSDGLDGCEPEKVDCLVIAGMGGDTIAGILQRGSWCKREGLLLLLQPMSKAEVLREWLSENGFSIVREERIPENGSLYQILTARFVRAKALSPAELYLGRKEVHANPDLYEEHRLALIRRFERAMAGMAQAQNRDMYIKIKELQAILDELRSLT